MSVDYDNVSRIYDVSRAANTETRGKLVSLLRVDSGSMLLDVGCGTGNYTAALEQIARSVIGIDISIGMISQARAKFPELKLICGDAAYLPFDPEVFDGAFVIQVFHHINEKESFLKEVYRVIRKGACIAIHSCSHKQLRAFWFYTYFPEGLEADLARIPDSCEIAALLEKTGFSDIGVEICYRDSVVVREAPQYYLNRDYRDSISTFALVTEEQIESGCEKLRRDIASGAVESVVRESEKVINETGGSSIVYGRK